MQYFDLLTLSTRTLSHYRLTLRPHSWSVLFVKNWQLTIVTSIVKIMEFLSIFTTVNATELIWIEEKSAPFLLFSFSQQTGIILGMVLLSGWLFGILGKLLVFKRISIQPLLSCPVNLLILVDEV